MVKVIMLTTGYSGSWAGQLGDGVSVFKFVVARRRKSNG